MCLREHFGRFNNILISKRCDTVIASNIIIRKLFMFNSTIRISSCKDISCLSYSLLFHIQLLNIVLSSPLHFIKFIFYSIIKQKSRANFFLLEMKMIYIVVLPILYFLPKFFFTTFLISFWYKFLRSRTFRQIFDFENFLCFYV